MFSELDDSPGRSWLLLHAAVPTRPPQLLTKKLLLPSASLRVGFHCFIYNNINNNDNDVRMGKMGVCGFVEM